MTLEEIKTNLADINKILMTDINEYEKPNMQHNNLADLYVRKGNALSAMQPLSAEVYANAKGLFSEAVKTHLLSLRDMLEEKKITVTFITKIAEGNAKEEMVLMHEAERCTRNISHSLDFIRSCISHQKAEMEAARWNHGAVD